MRIIKVFRLLKSSRIFFYQRLKSKRLHRLLVKPVKSAISYMPMVLYELPYEGAKEMLLVEEVENKEFLTGLFNAMYEELPIPKTKKKK